MPTLKQDLTIQQGATFQFVFALTGPNLPADISAFTARMQIRPWRDSEELYADWASPDEIQVNNVNKQIVLSVDESATADMNFIYGEYDLELEGNNTVWRIAEGVATMSREVTRA